MLLLIVLIALSQILRRLLSNRRFFRASSVSNGSQHFRAPAFPSAVSRLFKISDIAERLAETSGIIFEVF